MRVFAAAGASAALLLVPLASGATFGRPADIPLGKQLISLAVGEATQDGLADVVTANASAPGMSILPGRGDGSFEKPLEHPEASGARAFVFGDFDGDGADELAVATASSIMIYAGIDGNLARRQTYAVQAPTALVTGDFDSDGNLDIVATSASRSVVVMLLGRGDDSFAPPVELPIGAPASSLTVADLNGDETADIAAAGPNLYLLFGNGDGTFDAYRAVTTPFAVRALAAEDLDVDSDTDLVAAGGQNQVAVLLNDGTGVFSAPLTYKVGGTPIALILDDVSSDGSTDILTLNRSTNDLSIIQGVGDGTFRSQSRLKVGRTPVALSLSDLNGDGRADIVVANKLSKSITVMLNGTDAPQPIVCVVPRVAHKLFATAKGLVTRAHCTVAPIRRKYSNRVRRNRVIAQNPVPGVRAVEGTAVTLVVSRGPRRV